MARPEELQFPSAVGANPAERAHTRALVAVAVVDNDVASYRSDYQGRKNLGGDKIGVDQSSLLPNISFHYVDAMCQKVCTGTIQGPPRNNSNHPRGNNLHF